MSPTKKPATAAATRAKAGTVTATKTKTATKAKPKPKAKANAVVQDPRAVSATVPPQVDDALAAIWHAFKSSGDVGARERLILQYAPLVKYVASRVATGLPASVDQADLVSYGIFLWHVGVLIALKDIGMPQDGLDKAARLATENPYYNPRPIEYAGIRELLENAYNGTRP